MDPNGFDHDDGMNAFTVEKSTVVRKKGVYVGGAPAYLMSQVHKERDLFSVVVSLSLALQSVAYLACFVQLMVISLLLPEHAMHSSSKVH